MRWGCWFRQMAGFALLFVLPMLAYVLVQVGRDVRRGHWWMVGWGVAMAALLVWMIGRILNDPGY